MRWACTPSRTGSTCTTCTPRSSTSSAWTTPGSSIATRGVPSDRPSTRARSHRSCSADPMQTARRSFPLFALLALAMVVSGASRAEYAIRDGDTVVFLGDSITAAQTYGKIIENYTLLRFPDRKVRFINAGGGGDTAAGGLARLERDPFDRGATVLIVAYGINDIGWGVRADAEHRTRYLDAILEIVERCNRRNVRAFI